MKVEAGMRASLEQSEAQRLVAPSAAGVTNRDTGCGHAAVRLRAEVTRGAGVAVDLAWAVEAEVGAVEAGAAEADHRSFVRLRSM